MLQFTIQWHFIARHFCRRIWYYFMFIWILDAWVIFSISVLVISSISWIIARTDILLYLGDVSYICCVFAIVLDARGRFSFTRFDETGNVAILLHRCACRVFYIYMHVCVCFGDAGYCRYKYRVGTGYRLHLASQVWACLICPMGVEEIAFDPSPYLSLLLWVPSVGRSSLLFEFRVFLLFLDLHALVVRLFIWSLSCHYCWLERFIPYYALCLESSVID